MGRKEWTERWWGGGSGKEWREDRPGRWGGGGGVERNTQSGEGGEERGSDGK